MELKQLLLCRSPGSMHRHLVLQAISEDKLIGKLQPMRAHWVSFAVVVIADIFRMIVRDSLGRVRLYMSMEYTERIVGAHLHYLLLLLGI